MSTPQREIKRASLLGLPAELRLEIYSYVCTTDLRHTILNEWRHTHSSQYGFKSVPDLIKDEKLIIPWLSLIRTCKALAVELRAVMKEPSFLAGEQNTTYVLDLEATRGGMALGAATWRQLPCAPGQARYLEAYYNASCGLNTWGDGGPHGITSGLYQTLNHLIHCGPMFDMERPLPQTMHIKELRVVVEERGIPAREEGNSHYRLRNQNAETTLYSLGSIVGQIVNTGVWRGFVDKVRLSTGDKVLNWNPAEVEGAGIPEYWNRYGFDWGMELYHRPEPWG
ncbi:hypothetical protein M409DRAFT_18043 [Zasmidium cellare ATCC 36951]|uniref:F-box domain-containing protein n=1 Tax=Zasmidium cellare ATCC 36951 TaxID=1080233 RepID=A0A6A6D002_ZASCE|nr:uncharacterized protein M409DRAFT_18043 [Zasmidium cellare ATCC 36951]KAF2171810.1 hypothetical protein M409DRAFT_18043 [Zasmidium cellare ATCC 36951]